MVATSPLRSGQEMRRIAEGFIWPGLKLFGLGERQCFGECLEHFLTLGFLQQIHWETLKPTFYIPSTELSPVFSQIRCPTFCRDSAARVDLSLEVSKALSHLFHSL